jgi:hypothetical protein
MLGELRGGEACRREFALLLAWSTALTGCVSLPAFPATLSRSPEAIRLSHLCGPAPAETKPPAPRALHVAHRFWDDCPFPKASDEHAIDEAYVLLRIAVAPTGTAQYAEVLCDPGYGFADAGRRCALAQKYVPAQDEKGNAVSGTMKVQIHFVRGRSFTR